MKEPKEVTVMRKTTIPLFAMALLAPACATTSDSSSDTPRDRNVITYEELVSLSAVSLYEAIQRLRPAWLRSRGPMSGGGATRSYPQVFMDGVQLGDIETLKTLRRDGVRELRFIPARDATTRFGTGYMAGVIEILSVGRRSGA
jgi:hypothetical protein